MLRGELERKPVPKRGEASPMSGLVLGVLTGIENQGQGLVAFDTSSVNMPARARTITPLTRQDIGRQVCLMFEHGDPTMPVILGLLHIGVDQTSVPVNEQVTSSTIQIEAKIDGERVLLEGHKEIVLKCGKASITLTHDGKILVRGTYLSSRSTGPNLIKGGSVQLN
ncbi:conserved protein of unknown function [Nitrospira defluvii]|uniref:DUF6484 domain-containing protein n=1 Tax=Nitrospira defluvii TaxID=330214 RepID=D8PEQ3_9BACT|nr:conserved protein of unknown function [Nitrospira defluvii]